MFGMTKLQFLKRSAKCMDEAGGLLLLIREIIVKEFRDEVNYLEAFKRMDNIRKELDSLFYEFERLSPPSSCNKLKRKILNVLIGMQEVVVTDLESLNAARKGLKEQSQTKLKESRDQLEVFRKDFHEVTKEVNILLSEKGKSKKIPKNS